MNVLLQIDENIREYNFKAFEKRYGQRPQIDPNENKKYRMERTENGEPVAYIKTSESTEIRLNSYYSPDYEANRWVQKYDLINRRTSVAMYGFSTGVYLGALIKKLRPDTLYFVYEPEESLFSFICGFIDLTWFIETTSIHLYVTESQKTMYEEDLGLESADFRPEMIGIVTPFYTKTKWFEEVCLSIERMAVASANFKSYRARKAMECRLYAWNHMEKGMVIKSLYGKIPEDTVGIIVSAGPSLKKNVEILKNIKNHAIIICTDRASSTLDEYNIVPDFVISADAIKSSEYLMSDILKDVPLLCSYQLNIEAQKLFHGRCIYYHGLMYEQDILGEDLVDINGLDQGGNVAGGAFVVCQLLGIKTIVFIGQDLAFTGGKHHADDKDEGVGAPGYSIRLAEGINGDTVQTIDMWLAFKDFFERQIEIHKELRVIDATEGGALIKGTEIMSLSDVAEMVKGKNIDVSEVLKSISYAQTRDNYIQTIKNEEKYMKDLDMIAENSHKLENICRQFLNICKYHDISDPKHKKRLFEMDSLRAEIYEATVYTMMEEYWIRDFYGIPDFTFMIRNNEEAIPVFENAIEFYHKLPDDCMSLKEKIQEAIEQGMKDNHYSGEL